MAPVDEDLSVEQILNDSTQITQSIVRRSAALAKYVLHGEGEPLYPDGSEKMQGNLAYGLDFGQLELGTKMTRTIADLHGQVFTAMLSAASK